MLKQPWRNKQSVDIWRWCRTPFESYRPQLRGESDNIRFVFHFIVRHIKLFVQLETAKRKPGFREERKKW